MTLDGSGDDKIWPHGLTFAVVIPKGIYLTAQEVDSLDGDIEIDNRSEWDEDVDDDIHGDEGNASIDDDANVVIEAEVEGEQIDDI